EKVIKESYQFGCLKKLYAFCSFRIKNKRNDCCLFFIPAQLSMDIVADISRLVDFMCYVNYFIVIVISITVFIFTVRFLTNTFSRLKITPQGKAVLVTGCDSGFGHEFAKRLDSIGFHVFATCLFPSGPGALELKKSCSSKLHILHMDVTQDESVKKGYEYVKENLQNSEMWAIVNNAGTARGLYFEFLSVEDFEVCINVNFLGMVRVTKAFLPLVKQAKGRIVNVTSLIGVMPGPHISPYASSKYAAVGFTDCIRQELDVSGVTVVSIEPEVFKTGLTSPEFYKKLKVSMMKHLDRTLEEDFVASFDKIGNFMTSFASDKVNIVVDDLEAAICLANPSYTYKPRRNILIRFYFFIYEIMPRSCQLLVAKLTLFIIYYFY
ncbi:unnamed protein product, partial [Larinioides sclopetarius]